MRFAIGTAHTQGTPTKEVSESRKDTDWWKFTLAMKFR